MLLVLSSSSPPSSLLFNYIYIHNTTACTYYARVKSCNEIFPTDRRQQTRRDEWNKKRTTRFLSTKKYSLIYKIFYAHAYKGFKHTKRLSRHLFIKENIRSFSYSWYFVRKLFLFTLKLLCAYHFFHFKLILASGIKIKLKKNSTGSLIFLNFQYRDTILYKRKNKHKLLLLHDSDSIFLIFFFHALSFSLFPRS